MKSSCHSEVSELHIFFQKWFNAELHKSNLVFQRFTTVLHPKFVLISPDGRKRTKNEIIQEIWDAYGSRDPQKNPMKLWIENYVYQGEFNTIHIITYEEWQINNSIKKGRLSTAIFEKTSNIYNNICWLHVHETWLE